VKIRTLVAACVAASAPLAAHAAEVKLKAASFLPVRSIVAKQFVRFVEETNKGCDGKVEISVVGPEAVPSLEQWNAVKNGVVDMHHAAPVVRRAVVHVDDAVLQRVPLLERGHCFRADDADRHLALALLVDLADEAHELLDDDRAHRQERGGLELHFRRARGERQRRGGAGRHQLADLHVELLLRVLAGRVYRQPRAAARA